MKQVVNISRYIHTSKFAHGSVLDCAAGSCYGSSILRRNGVVKSITSVDIDRDILRYGKMVYDASCVMMDAANPPFREMSFDTVVSISLVDYLYRSTLSQMKSKKQKVATLMDPDPRLFPHVGLKATSNVMRWQYFVIQAHKV